jgi:NAD(P)-dependent dehydrogenase (short-subunit alcohol dehydrogenase family)
VNNAGVLEPIARLAEVDAEALWRNVTVNLFAPFLLTRTALPYLRERRGRVINVSTGAAVRPVAGWSAYGAAKAGLNLLTMTLAKEEPTITTIAVRPGVVDTEMQRQIREEGQGGMEAASHQNFMSLYEGGELLEPEVPGEVLALLALHAPREWSGRFLSWDDEEVARLVSRISAPSA